VGKGDVSYPSMAYRSSPPKKERSRAGKREALPSFTMIEGGGGETPGGTRHIRYYIHVSYSGEEERGQRGETPFGSIREKKRKKSGESTGACYFLSYRRGTGRLSRSTPPPQGGERGKKKKSRVFPGAITEPGGKKKETRKKKKK